MASLNSATGLIRPYSCSICSILSSFSTCFPRGTFVRQEDLCAVRLVLARLVICRLWYFGASLLADGKFPYSMFCIVDRFPIRNFYRIRRGPDIFSQFVVDRHVFIRFVRGGWGGGISSLFC